MHHENSRERDECIHSQCSTSVLLSNITDRRITRSSMQTSNVVCVFYMEKKEREKKKHHARAPLLLMLPSSATARICTMKKNQQRKEIGVHTTVQHRYICFEYHGQGTQLLTHTSTCVRVAREATTNLEIDCFELRPRSFSFIMLSLQCCCSRQTRSLLWPQGRRHRRRC